MSGVAGIYYLNGKPVTRAETEAMRLPLMRRGPHGFGYYECGSLGLVQTQLWTTPESVQEKLPLSSRDGQVVITADARVDNRAELIPQLDLDPSAVDSEVILAAYRKWGEGCTLRLIGDFAFAIWDAQLGKLFCARDAFGVKPFFFYLSRDIFAFGSEIKALLALPQIPREINAPAVCDYMLELYEDKSRTFYADIYSLPPANFMWVCPDCASYRPYWSLDGERELRLKSDEEYAEAYRELFVEAVRCRVRSAYPVGSTLSGGLDSSSVSGVAGKLLAEQGRKLHTFSAVFDDSPQSDERPFIQEVLNQGLFIPQYVRGDLASPTGYLDTLLQEQDQPFHAPHLFLNYQLWSAAEKQGVRVLLEGLMGDNVINHGFHYLTELAHSWRWGELYRQINLLSKNHNNPAPLNQLMARYIWQDGIKANIPPQLMAIYRRLRGRPVQAQGYVPAIIQPDYAARLGLAERLAGLNQTAAGLKTSRQVHRHELESGLIPTALNIYSIGIATFSLDVRLPFLDRRFVEFCLAVPVEQKLAGGYSRMITRRALHGYLPEKIRWRSGKGDLSWNLIRLLKMEQEKLEATFTDAAPYLSEYLNMTVVNAMSRRVVQGTATEDQVMFVYLAAILGKWLTTRSGVQETFVKGGD